MPEDDVCPPSITPFSLFIINGLILITTPSILFSSLYDPAFYHQSINDLHSTISSAFSLSLL